MARVGGSAHTFHPIGHRDPVRGRDSCFSGCSYAPIDYGASWGDLVSRIGARLLSVQRALSRVPGRGRASTFRDHDRGTLPAGTLAPRATQCDNQWTNNNAGASVTT